MTSQVRNVAGQHSRGIILPGVLIILAFASAVVMMMISLQDIAIQRSRRFNEAAQARAYVRGGESSAIAALRRDGSDAPETDNTAEPWANIAETARAIENGSFSIVVTDEQARFNINNLADGNLTDRQIFMGLAISQNVTAAIAVRVADLLGTRGAIGSLDDLEQVGMSRAEIGRLSEVLVALPKKTLVNINTASEALLAALLSNRVAARQIAERRSRRGFLLAADLDALRVPLPPGSGFTSEFFLVTTSVTIGDTAQGASTLLQRTIDGIRVDVAAVSRTNKGAAPFPAPP